MFDSRTKAWKNRAITVARWIRPARYVSRASVRDIRFIGSDRCAAVANFRPIFLRCVTKSRFFLSSFFFFLPSVDKLHWQIYQWSRGNLRAPIKRDSASRHIKEVSLSTSTHRKDRETMEKRGGRIGRYRISVGRYRRNARSYLLLFTISPRFSFREKHSATRRVSPRSVTSDQTLNNNHGNDNRGRGRGREQRR